MKYLTLLTGLLALALPTHAFANDNQIVEASFGLSSSLHDRGEQISLETFDLAVSLEKRIAAGVSLYGGFHRLQPLGSSRDVFDDETNFFAGLTQETDRYGLDISANFLTYQGADTRPSLELVTVLGLGLPLSPNLTGFYDVQTEDFGIEAAFGPQWVVRQTSISLLGRAGHVSVAEDNLKRNYIGAEAGLSFAVTGNMEIAGFARFDISDRDSFLDATSELETITAFKKHGTGFGVSLTLRD